MPAVKGHGRRPGRARSYRDPGGLMTGDRYRLLTAAAVLQVALIAVAVALLLSH